jgi:uncharacterized protein (TIGR02001 family)
MKSFFKTGLILALLTASGFAQADLTANIGYASEYIFRGIPQKNSSASGGLDFTSGGFYVGTWAADVGDGLETDLYFGYGGDAGDFSYSVGYTGYFYTGDFDDTYQEINLGGGYGPLSVDVALGQYANFSGPTQDYSYYAVTYSADNGLYGKVAGFGRDFTGNYLELGYGTTVSDIDLGVALIFSDSDLLGGQDDQNIVFTIGKTFDLK